MIDNHQKSLIKSCKSIEGTSFKECPLQAVVTKSQTPAGSVEVSLTHCTFTEDLSDKERLEQVQEALQKLTGCSGSALPEFILEETLKCMPKTKNLQKQYNACLQAFHQMQPTDAIEATLCSQAIALYVQGMASLNKFHIGASLEHSQIYLNAASKLLRLQQETLEKLEKYRRKGEQRVIVQHVQVNNGGKAIVGNFQANGGGDGKNI